MRKYLNNVLPKKSFIRNFSVLLSTNIIVTVISMFTSIYIARILKPNSYGEYGVILSIVGILQVFSGMGLSATVTRQIARNQSQSKIVFNSSFWSYLFGITFTFIIFLLYYLFSENHISIEIFILIFLNIISLSFWTLFQNVAFGMERMESNGLINLIFSVLLLLTYVILPLSFISVLYVFSISTIFQFLKAILYFWVCKKEKVFTGESNFLSEIAKSSKLLKDSVPFLIMGIFSMLSNQIPILFLNTNSGSSQVAYYNTANKLLLPITLVITTAMTAIYPNLSKLYVENKEEYSLKIKTVINGISFVGVIGALFVIMFRNEIVELVYGVEYIQTGNVMAYQSLFMIAFALFCFIGGIFSSSDNQKLLSKLSIIYALVSVPILWFGSKYGAEYLSLAFIVTAIVNITYHWYFLQKILPIPLTKKFTIKTFLLLIFPLSAFFLKLEFLSILIRLIVFTIIFIVLILLNFKTIKILFYKFKRVDIH